MSYQMSIFAENKPGRLAKITSILGREKINIRAITISTSDVFGVVNMIVDRPQEAFKAIEKEGMTVKLKEVIAVIIDDKPGGLDSLVQLLLREKVNVENAYGFVLESWKNAVFVIDVDQIERTQSILEKAGFRVLDAEALASAEPFHYMNY
ncbi:MAG: ACT domain-containing protein [Deltaproteobacteria bacterium]|nr:ACT domain-containing protein [Deltaproteobacteria bacterium]